MAPPAKSFLDTSLARPGVEITPHIMGVYPAAMTPAAKDDSKTGPEILVSLPIRMSGDLED